MIHYNLKPNKLKYMKTALTIFLSIVITGLMAQNPNTIKLKDYRPKSIFKIPVSTKPKAKYPVIDMHSHAYANNEADLAKWVKNMDAAGIEKTIIMTQFTGASFDSVYAKYAPYGKRFEVLSQRSGFARASRRAINGEGLIQI